MRCVSALVLVLAVASAVAQTNTPVLLQAEDLPVPVEQGALQAQFDLLSRMSGVYVAYAEHGPVSVLTGNTQLMLRTPRTQARVRDLEREIARRLQPLLLATGDETLSITQLGEIEAGIRRIELSESIGGIPVASSSVRLEVREPSGAIESMKASFLPARNLPRAAPKLSAQQAQANMIAALVGIGRAEAGAVNATAPPVLQYFGVEPRRPHGVLVWKVSLAYGDPNGERNEQMIWVNALDGAVVTMGYLGRQTHWWYRANEGCFLEPAPSQPERPAGCAVRAPQPRFTQRSCGVYHVHWDDAPGVSRYYAQLVRGPYDFWFAEDLVDGPYNACIVNVPAAAKLRVRACNGCGCSEWSEIVDLPGPEACN